MKKYIESSERSERLANIQRTRQQRLADTKQQAFEKYEQAASQFQTEYGSRISDVYDTWLQLVEMRELNSTIRFNGYTCRLVYDHGRINGWMETSIPYYFYSGMSFSSLYIEKSGTVGHKYEIPYGSAVGSFSTDGFGASDYKTFDDVVHAITKLPSFVEALENYIYEIADGIEE